MLVVISGKGRSGKDTSAIILKQLFLDMGETCVGIAYADFLKEILGKCFNLNYNHLYGSLKEDSLDHLPIRTRSGKTTNHNWTTRKLLQFLGTDVMRTIDPDCWVNVVKNFVNTSSSKYDNIIITDARFFNEIDWVLQKGGTHIHIRRQNSDYVGGTEHSSETSLDTDSFSEKHYVIDNDKDLIYLEESLQEIINKEKNYGR